MIRDYVWVGVAERLERNSIPMENGCILWTSTRQRTKQAYGMIQMQRMGGGHCFTAAHRIAYIIRYGDVPDGMEVIHTCNHQHCINPAHLTLGTPKERVRISMDRGHTDDSTVRSVCPNGHPMTKDNLRKRGKDRAPRCRECNRQQQRAHHRRTYKPKAMRSDFSASDVVAPVPAS